MNAQGISILVIVLSMVIFGSRRWAVIGMLAGALYLTQAQYINILGINIFAIRFVEVAGFIRIIATGDFKFNKLCSIDKAFILLITYTAFIYISRSDEGTQTAIGRSIDYTLCYFAFRGLGGGIDDYCWVLKRFTLLLGPYAGMVVLESVTGNNLFAALGGGNFNTEGWMRGGRLRSQGSFRHASLLGTVGASFIPLYIGLWFRKADRRLAVLGIAFSLAIVWASNSGGPLSSTAVGVLGWALWKFRFKTGAFRRYAVLGIIALVIAMKAPIWYLLARLSSFTGGDGWHRARLLDVAFQNLDQWWLWGMDIHDTSDWLPYTLSITGGADMTNQYLNYGIQAGILALFFFLALIALTYKQIGKAISTVRSSVSTPTDTEYLFWSLGVMITVHCATWFGITYFDQTYVIWCFQLAVVANLTGKGVLANLIDS